MRIYRISSARDKIMQYGIKDPFLIFFLYKYEVLIPWVQINSEDEIIQYINDRLLPSLMGKIDIDSAKNNYIKDIDIYKEFRARPDHPVVREAKKIYDENPNDKDNVKKAKEKIINAINYEKEINFKEWLNYVTKVNDIYMGSPPFIYSVLKPVIDSSVETDMKSPIPLNEIALASLYHKIKNSQGYAQFSVKKQYQEELNEVNKKQSEFSPVSRNKRDGWIRIPGKNSDAENFEKNVKKLMSYGIQSGWCVGQVSFAEDYLSKGDFHLYIENNKPKVAIRMVGNLIEEIRGENNRNPYEYIGEIERFMGKENIRFNENSTIIKTYLKEIEDYRNLNDNPENIKTHIKMASESALILAKLTKENQEKYSLLIVEELARGFMNLNDPLSYYKGIPENIRKMLQNDHERWKHIIQVIINHINSGKNLNRIVIDIKDLPEDLLKFPEINKAISKFVVELAETQPWMIEELEEKYHSIIPSNINMADNIVVQTIRNLKQYNGDGNPEKIIYEIWGEPDRDSYWSYYEGNFISDEHQKEYEEEMERYEKSQEYLKNTGYEDVREIDEVQSVLEDAWMAFIRKNLEDADEVYNNQSEYTYYYEQNEGSPGYLFQDSIMELIWQLWNDRIWEDPKELMNAPDHISEQYYYDDKESPHHYTNIWLEYLIRGHMDEIKDRGALEAIKNMNSEQLSKLISNMNSEQISKLMEEIDYSIFDDNLYDVWKEKVENIKKQKEKEKTWEVQKEKGQQEMPFLEEVPLNKTKVDESGVTIPACGNNWYRRSIIMKV